MENALLSYTKEGKGGTFVWKGYAVLLKDFWRSKEGGRNVSLCRMTMWRSNKIWCKFQLSSIIPS